MMFRVVIRTSRQEMTGNEKEIFIVQNTNREWNWIDTDPYYEYVTLWDAQNFAMNYGYRVKEDVIVWEQKV